MNEPAPAQILVVSDDAAAYLAQAEVLWSTEWPAIQLVRSEQLLFGAADTTQVLVRDAATVPECALASLPGVDILLARDLGQARELAQRVLARSHSADVSADSVAHHCETFEAGEFVQRALAPLEMERVTRHPVQSDSEDFPLHSAVDAHMPGAGTARNRRASSPVVVILNAVGGAGASTLAWAAAAFYESTRGSAAIVDGDDRSPGLDIWTCDETAPAVRWPDLAAVAGAVDPQRFWQCLIHVAPNIRLLSQGRVPVSPSAATAAAVCDALSDRSVVVDFSSTRGSAAMAEILGRATAVIVVSTATVSGCAAARTRINSVRHEIQPGVPVLAALRERHPGVSLAAAREALDIEVFALPDDPRVARCLRERNLRLFRSQRWAPLGRALESSTDVAADSAPRRATVLGPRHSTGAALHVLRGAKG